LALISRNPLFRYGFAVACVAAATLVSFTIQETTSWRSPYLTFIPAIILSAYAGTGPGMLAVLLAATASPTLLQRTTGSFNPHDSNAWFTEFMFVLVTTMMVVICRNARLAKISAEIADERSRQHERQKLAKSEELETVLKAVPAAIFIAHDRACEQVTGSSNAYKILGMPEGVNVSMTPGPAGNLPPITVRGPQDQPISAENMPLQKAAAGLAQRDVQFDVIRADGTRVALFGNSEPLFDSNGTPRGAVGAFVDVTNVLAAERAAHKAAERFRIMADTAPVMVWMDDTNKSCVWVNKPWMAFTGRTMEQEAGKGWTQSMHPDDRERCRQNYDTHFDDRKPFAIEYRLRRADGEYRWVLDQGIPLYEGEGSTFSGYIGSCIDITDRRLAEEQKAALLDAERAARMESERIGRMKDEFLGTLSHELRTPLSAILGWSQMLTRGESDPEQVKQGLEAIARNARAQTQIIEDLLDMSRIISGKIRLNVQPINPCDVVEAAIESIQPAAEAKKIRLVKVIDPLAGPVSGDPGRLQQVVWNLLTNAIKFTPAAGKVEVVLQRVNSHVEICVADTGAGIKPEFLPHVFERFRQDDSSTTRKHGGLGIGLSIVKQLVELHGGSVQVSSDGENCGATFVVALPMAVTRVDAAEERRHPTAIDGNVRYEPPRLDGVRVLVVDDDADTRFLIQRIFGLYGAVVTVAGSGADALLAVVGERPQIIVSDIGMPMMDGFEFIRRVRALPAEQGASTPAIALTAFARSEDRQRALMAGYQMHMAKPVEPAELVIACGSLVGRSTAAIPQSV